MTYAKILVNGRDPGKSNDVATTFKTAVAANLNFSSSMHKHLTNLRLKWWECHNVRSKYIVMHLWICLSNSAI